MALLRVKVKMLMVVVLPAPLRIVCRLTREPATAARQVSTGTAVRRGKTAIRVLAPES
jgi:hypothetical protein